MGRSTRSKKNVNQEVPEGSGGGGDEMKKDQKNDDNEKLNEQEGNISKVAVYDYWFF